MVVNIFDCILGYFVLCFFFSTEIEGNTHFTLHAIGEMFQANLFKTELDFSKDTNI